MMSSHLRKDFRSAAADPAHTFQDFDWEVLEPYLYNGHFDNGVSPDYRIFHVGWDDVHGILKELYSRVAVKMKTTNFGYADDELNDVIWHNVETPTIFAQLTFDSSQAGSVKHTKAMLEADQTSDPEKYATVVAVGRSETGQIIHTKGACLDGVVAYGGSTNLSAAGEGIGIGLHGASSIKGYKAQANELTVFRAAPDVIRFETILDYQHAVAKAQMAAKAEKATPTPTGKKR